MAVYASKLFDASSFFFLLPLKLKVDNGYKERYIHKNISNCTLTIIFVEQNASCF